MSLLHFTDHNFKKEVLECELPVLVDFWAPWCGPCKMIAPILEELAREYKDKMHIGKINIDESSKMAAHYGVMSIPTLMFFHRGKVSGQVVGVITKADLKKSIEENI